jgi:hypothetical protein
MYSLNVFVLHDRLIPPPPPPLAVVRPHMSASDHSGYGALPTFNSPQVLTFQRENWPFQLVSPGLQDLGAPAETEDKACKTS